jgi:hypothetical protein
VAGFVLAIGGDRGGMKGVDDAALPLAIGSVRYWRR